MSLPLTEWIVAGGLVAVFLLMLGETLFPPIPSEIIMPLAGFRAAQGDMDILAVILVGTAGAMLGNAIWYGLARAWGEARFKRFTARWGRITTIDPEDVDAARRWFSRHGAAAVLVGRMIPTIRSIISVPAGLARMPAPRFLVFSSLGTGGWTAALAGGGYALGARFAQVERYLDPVSTGVVALVVGLYLYRLATHGRRSARHENARDG